MLRKERKIVTVDEDINTKQKKIKIKRVYKEDGKDINDVMNEYVKSIMLLNT